MPEARDERLRDTKVRQMTAMDWLELAGKITVYGCITILIIGTLVVDGAN